MSGDWRCGIVAISKQRVILKLPKWKKNVRNRLTDKGEWTCGCSGGGGREGERASLGLADGKYYTQNGYITRPYDTAQGTRHNIL